MKELEIANWLNEGSKSKANTNQVGGRTRTYTGTALADSDHGRVVVDMGGDSVTAEGEQGVEIPCGPQVKKGDRVLITTVNGSPYVSSVDGWGDYIGDQAAYASLYVGELDARHITAQRIDAATAYIGELEAGEITAEKITATTGFFDDLTADNITAQTIIADSATIGDLVADHVTTSQLEAATARIGDLEADHVSTTDLTAVNASISSLQSDKADISYLAANYATIDLANVNNAWIDHGVIRDAAISSAQIIGVSANKLTAGTINGSVINVTNLNADNITAGTLNGQRLGQGTIDLDKLSADVYTEDEVDAIVSGLDARIDAQIETWTTDAVPTLNNYPASSWNTNDLKAEHVGDICYVINAASEMDGYTYRFAFDNTNQAYSWILIKDNQVTAALGRLLTAEGKIEGLESFESSTSTWITQTDSGIETLRTQTTTLATDFGTFQTETFADLVDEVDEQSSTITTLSETTSTISNTVNSVSQTASSNSSKISGLITTVGANSDGTNPGSSSIISRTSAVEQDLSGFKTTVSSTYATKESVKGVNLGEFYSHDLTDIYDATDNPNAWWRQEATRATALENGWAHIVMDNTENSSTMYAGIYPNIGSIPVVEGTLLIEIKNMVTNAGSSQLWYNASGTTSGTQVPAMTNKNGTTALVNGVRYHTMIPTENNNPTMWARSWFGISDGKSAEFDVRLSYYEGEYDGPYKPYVDQTLSSRVKFAESAIIQNANNISIKVSQTDFEEGISDAATKATGYITDFGANGVKVHPLNSTNDYALIDATGLEVYDGGTSVARFTGGSGAVTRIGTEAGNHINIGSSAIDIMNGQTSYTQIAPLSTRIGSESMFHMNLLSGSASIYNANSLRTIGIKSYGVYPSYLGGQVSFGATDEVAMIAGGCRLDSNGDPIPASEQVLIQAGSSSESVVNSYDPDVTIIARSSTNQSFISVHHESISISAAPTTTGGGSIYLFADNIQLGSGNTNISISAPLVLSRAIDASGTADNGPALIVGGARTAAHLEFDANEIMAKGSGTTTATLCLNNDGGIVETGNGGIRARNGNILRKNTSMNNTSSSLSANTYSNISFTDTNDKYVSYIQCCQRTDGSVEVTLAARHSSDGTTNYDNALTLKIGSDNSTRTVSVSSPTAWRKALHVGSATVRLSSNTASKTTNTKLTLASFANSDSLLFTAPSSGGIKCLVAGTVWVSATAFATGGGGGLAIMIYKNSTNVLEIASVCTDFGTTSISPYPVSVAANDVIYLYARTTVANATIEANKTYLTVQYMQ